MWFTTHSEYDDVDSQDEMKQTRLEKSCIKLKNMNTIEFWLNNILLLSFMTVVEVPKMIFYIIIFF